MEGPVSFLLLQDYPVLQARRSTILKQEKGDEVLLIFPGIVEGVPLNAAKAVAELPPHALV